jgi:hypothetical protein
MKLLTMVDDAGKYARCFVECLPLKEMEWIFFDEKTDDVYQAWSRLLIDNANRPYAKLETIKVYAEDQQFEEAYVQPAPQTMQPNQNIFSYYADSLVALESTNISLTWSFFYGLEMCTRLKKLRASHTLVDSWSLFCFRKMVRLTNLELEYVEFANGTLDLFIADYLPRLKKLVELKIVYIKFGFNLHHHPVNLVTAFMTNAPWIELLMISFLEPDGHTPMPLDVMFGNPESKRIFLGRYERFKGLIQLPSSAEFVHGEETYATYRLFNERLQKIADARPLVPFMAAASRTAQPKDPTRPFAAGTFSYSDGDHAVMARVKGMLVGPP